MTSVVWVFSAIVSKAFTLDSFARTIKCCRRESMTIKVAAYNLRIMYILYEHYVHENWSNAKEHFKIAANFHIFTANKCLPFVFFCSLVSFGLAGEQTNLK